MNKNVWSILTCLLILGMSNFYSCSEKIQVAKVLPTLSKEDKMEQTAKDIFKQNYVLEYNLTNTVVCISKAIKRRPNDILTTLSFVLYHLEKEEILFQEIIPRAKGKWINEEEFRVIVTPGRMPPNKGVYKRGGFVYNVEKKIKRQI